MRFARVFTTVATSITILMLFLMSTAVGHASTLAHGCAQPTPPPVSGSPVIPPATPGIVVINEILNNPNSTWNCSETAGTYSLMTDSWIEIYNPQSQPFNLYAARAALDAGPNTFTFHFPFGAAIAARGFFVVFPDVYAGMLAASNNLQLTIGGTAVDQVSIPALAPDTSYARIPDGSANWQITTNPTINASNLSSTQVTVTPTPVSTKKSGNPGNKGSGYSGSGSGSTTTTPTLVTGKQPDWTKLQLPATNSLATPTSNSSRIASPTASPSSNTWDVPRRIVLTVLVIALALSLFWCWKLFSSA